jgi:lysophospholipase L1-like esterase
MSDKQEYEYITSYDGANWTTGWKPSDNMQLDAINKQLLNIANGMNNIPTYARNTVVLFGDSITALNQMGDDIEAGAANFYCVSSFGFFTWANVLLGQRFKILKNAGIGGNTTTQMLARIQTDVINYAPSFCTVVAGANDIMQNVSTATVKSNLLTIYQTLISNGINVIAGTIPPISSAGTTTAQKQAIIEVNNYIRSLKNTLKNFILIDWFEDLVNPATGGYATNLCISDYVHPSVQGAYKMGYKMYSILDPIIPKISVFSGSNLFDTKNPFSNPYALGGTTLATGLTVTPTTNITSSKVARNNSLEWQQVSNSGSAVNIQLYWLASSGFSVGQKVSGYMEFEIDSAATSIDNFMGGILAMNSSYTTLASAYALPMSGADTTIRFGQNAVSGIMYIPRFTIPANTASLMLQFSSTQAGAFRIGRIRVILE